MLFILIEYTLTWQFQCDWTRQMCPTKIALTVSHIAKRQKRSRMKKKITLSRLNDKRVARTMCVKFMNFKDSCDENADQNTVRTRLGTRRNIHEIQRNRQFGICDECVVRDAVFVIAMPTIGCDELLLEIKCIASLHHLWMRSGLFTSNKNIGSSSRSHSALALFLCAYKTHHHNKICHFRFVICHFGLSKWVTCCPERDRTRWCLSCEWSIVDFSSLFIHLRTVNRKKSRIYSTALWILAPIRKFVLVRIGPTAT